MKKTLNCPWLLIVLDILWVISCSVWSPAAETLESSILRIEVTMNRYSFRVVEKSTGEVLVSQDGTAFTFGPELCPVTEAANLMKSPDSIKADLLVELAGRDRLPKGSPDRAQVTFTFVKPEVLQVRITYDQGAPDEISEQFNDQGEHYYGVWEYPFGGHIDNRGADADFLGLGNQRYVHHASARAPFYVTSRRYGIYVESLAQGHYAIAQVGKTVFSFKDSQLKYDIIYGRSYVDVFKRYNVLAGPAIMPPSWAFGSIWWRDDEHDDLCDVHNAQEKVMDDAGPKRTVWYDYDDELVGIARKYAQAHHELIPYTRSYMYQARQTGMPIMRALIFAYPADERLTDMWDEYLYGGEILVAPVATANATDRKVYLPAGRWMNYNDKHSVYDGKASITAAAALGVIPLFVREGAIIPRGDIVKLNNNWDANWEARLRIEVFPSAQRESQFAYFTGTGVQVIKSTPKNGGWAFEFGDLGVNGALEVYCQKAEHVRKNGTALREGTDYHVDARKLGRSRFRSRAPPAWR